MKALRRLKSGIRVFAFSRATRPLAKVPTSRTPLAPESREGIPNAVKGWVAFFALVLLELWLLYIIPPTILSDAPLFARLVEGVATIAPSIHNLDRIAPHPEKINFYMALTLVLVIPKVAFIYWWLNSSHMDNYRHLVISPLTGSRPERGGEFVTAPLHEEQAPRPQRPRSMLSRIVWSLATLGLVGFLTANALVAFRWQAAKGAVRSLDPAFLEVAAGGVRLWLEWSVVQMSLISLLLAIGLCVLRDYAIWIARRVRR